MSHTPETVKNAAKAILDTLPDDASWEDVQYRFYVRQQIDAGLEGEAAGRLIDTAEMQRRLAEHKIQRKKAAR
ncbi:hypothetical protein [Lignipirellula cremea]|uniref:Addiction module component n=1 Tax=Lignipirellula cremea TaxID=2528010 RepID=A0A518DXR9_9BACT|nr:hypothetical protein [Lignipirellula cremea]QDU96642.1 hypothetical protein Pla8534_44630 [Lignipirellula cremea]